MVRFLKLLLKIFAVLIGLVILSGLGYYLYSEYQKSKELNYPSEDEWSWHSYPWQINSDGDRLRAVDLDSRYQIVLGVRALSEEEFNQAYLAKLELLQRHPLGPEDNPFMEPYSSRLAGWQKEMDRLPSEENPILAWTIYFEQDCIPKTQIAASLICSDDGTSLYISGQKELSDSDPYHRFPFSQSGFSASGIIGKNALSPLLRAAALANAQPASAE
jgi:hypothetical protein